MSGNLENTPGPDSPPESQPPAPDFAAATQPPYVRTLLFGPDGLRPGWGFAFYVVMSYFLYWLANDLEERYGPAGSLRSMMLEEFCALLAAVIPSLVLAKIERRPWETYGLPPRQAFRKLFWVGATWGFAGITLLLGTLNRIHVFDFGHLALHGPRIVKYAAFWAVMFLLVGCFEEFLLRGYAQFTLTRAVGFWWAAISLSCAFGLIHIRNAEKSGTACWPWHASACSLLLPSAAPARCGLLWAFTPHGIGAKHFFIQSPTAASFSPVTCSSRRCTEPAGSPGVRSVPKAAPCASS